MQKSNGNISVETSSGWLIKVAAALAALNLSACHHAPKRHHKAQVDPQEVERSLQARNEIDGEFSSFPFEPEKKVISEEIKTETKPRTEAGTEAAPNVDKQADVKPGGTIGNKAVAEPERKVTLAADVSSAASNKLVTVPVEPLRRLNTLEFSGVQLSHSNETPLIFDIPVTYNDRVKNWIRFFQTEGRSTFKNWLERSSRFLPVLQYELQQAKLPQDLVYVAMIESGFVSNAASHADAVGMWQFIGPTAERYHLRIDWWIDERRDFHKATQAAIRYMSDLYSQFNSWYLVAASYNMGEGGVRRLIARHKTNNFWELAEHGALPRETADYVPKIIAAMLISKAPALYGFRDLAYQMPLSFETVSVPGGTDIINLATYLGVSEKYLKDLNPELIKGFIPAAIRKHKIRVPKGSTLAVSQFARAQGRRESQYRTENNNAGVSTALREETGNERL